MATRRQSSTTSLSKYARANSPVQNPSMDFCNAFWGAGDGGVDVLFARMRGAIRTIDELRSYWKERYLIEEDYAKRLGKLSKMTLGKDEIGELRQSLDLIRLETDRQSGFHHTLATQIRSELEGQTNVFYERQMDFKKKFQASVEREFKAKQTQESYVVKAREKYEQDCMRINSYTAQSTLVQGKDLEKIRGKLERAQQTVGANEKDFRNFAKAYTETRDRWEMIWVDFCDKAQDLEEDRMDFIKDNMWAYANAVSSVCVSDDESCERVRVQLETMDVDREQDNFVRDYGTGNQIPDAILFVDYNSPDAIPSLESKPRFHTAHFQHVTDSIRSKKIMEQSLDNPQPPHEEPLVNSAGVGAGARMSQTQETLTRQPTTNGHKSSSSQHSIPRKPPMQEDSAHSSEETYIKVGSNAYRADPNNDPQSGGSSRAGGPVSSSPVKTPISAVDPLAKQLEELQSAVSNVGTVRRNSTWRGPPEGNATVSRRGTMNLAAPAAAASSSARSPSPSRDYRNSADIVVGVHPSAQSSTHSRPVSPSASAPTAAFMTPRNAVSPSGSEDVVGVLKDYQQSLPGERKSVSRRGSYVGPSPVNPQPPSDERLGRPVSRQGHAGIGAHGGSRSPSPHPVSRGPSPALQQPPQPVVQRATSPNSVGIALDPSGRVLHDDMAQRYQQQQRSAPQYQQPVQRRTSYVSAPPPPQQQTPAYSGGYVPQQPVYQPPPQPAYAPPPAQQYQPPPQQYVNGYNAPAGGVQRAPSAGYYAPPSQQQSNLRPSQQTQAQQNGRTPSPAHGGGGATGQVLEDGSGILFYVQALYDYRATIDEEFDFTAGDIIAVTATPEDGWWSGQLLDENRRIPGRHIFPSNFVTLF